MFKKTAFGDNSKPACRQAGDFLEWYGKVFFLPPCFVFEKNKGDAFLYHRKIMVFIFSLLLVVNTCGCVALLAGAAGGIGTATWLSGKLTQEVNAPFEKSLKAAKSALRSLKLNITKETVKDDVAQIMSNYTDGKTIWIDIHRVSMKTSRIEVRVGATSGNQEAERKILDRIERYL